MVKRRTISESKCFTFLRQKKLNFGCHEHWWCPNDWRKFFMRNIWFLHPWHIHGIHTRTSGFCVMFFYGFTFGGWTFVFDIFGRWLAWITLATKLIRLFIQHNLFRWTEVERKAFTGHISGKICMLIKLKQKKRHFLKNIVQKSLLSSCRFYSTLYFISALYLVCDLYNDSKPFSRLLCTALKLFKFWPFTSPRVKICWR